MCYIFTLDPRIVTVFDIDLMKEGWRKVEILPALEGVSDSIEQVRRN